MKIEWILTMIIPSFISIEACLLSNAHFFSGQNLFWSLINGVSLAVISLGLKLLLVEMVYPLLTKWPRIRNWLIKKREKDDPWVIRIYNYRYWGLFFGGLVPTISIPAQRIFKFKYGYTVISAGYIAIAFFVIIIMKISEYLM